MAKTQSEGQLDLKPKYEPIEYEEELNFDLQTPQANQPEVKITQKQEESIKEEVKDVTDSKGQEESNEHRVTVMVHRQQEQKKVEVKEEAKVEEPKVEVKVKDEVKKEESPKVRKNSHVTVIKLGSNDLEQQGNLENLN